MNLNFYTINLFSTTWHPIELLIIITLVYVILILIISLLPKSYLGIKYNITTTSLFLYFAIIFILLLIPIIHSVEILNHASNSTLSSHNI